MSEQSSFRIHCQTSEDPESACCECEGPLQEGSLQISITDSQGKKKCYDLECFVKDRVKYKFFKSGNCLPGFKSLKAADKRAVNQALPLIEDPEKTRKRKASDLDEVEPEDQAKKKKSSGMEVVDEPVSSMTPHERYPWVTPEPMDGAEIDFAIVSTLPNYIDKTMLVAQVQNGTKVTLLTAPRRWGKSVGISSLNYFYQIQTKPSGEKMTGVDILEDNILVKDTSNYLLFERTMLENIQPDVMEHLGKYPVIWIEFRGSVANGEDALTNIRHAIRAAYQAHSYLINSEQLAKSSQNISYIEEWCGLQSHQQLDWNKVVLGIKTLSELLWRHWGRKCVILMDEYDAITMSLLRLKTLTPDDFEFIQTNMTRMLANTFKNNQFMYKGFLTGISYVAGIWSELTHVDLCRFSWSHKFTKYYGLAEGEVKRLLTVNGVLSEFESVRACYNGYVTRGVGSFYCPWSIIKYLNDEEKRLRGYWCDSGAIFLLYQSFSNPEIRKIIHKLINGQAVTVAVRQILTVKDFEKVQAFIRNPRSKLPKNLIFTMFLDQGCLASADAKPIENLSVRHLKPVDRQLKIPNEEIREHFREQLVQHADDIYVDFNDEREDLEKSFRDIFTSVNSAGKLRAALERFVSDMDVLVQAVFPDKKLVNHEVIRDLLILAAFPACPKFYPEYNVKSSDVPDGGKVDYCSMYENRGKKIALILEIKVNADTAAAKKQIIDKHYFRALDAEMFEGAEEAIIMGLCVSNPTQSQEIPWEVELIYTLRGGSPNTTETYENKTWTVVKAVPRPNE